jgi:hypothetical protein
MRQRAEEGTLGTNFRGDSAVLGYSKKYWSNVADEVQMYKDQPVRRIFDKTGRTYEVDIHADLEDFLDWDAPLSQQSAKARKGLASIDKDMYGTAGADYDPSELGQQTYHRMLSRFGESKVSSILADKGIPGIKYLDEGSRAAGKGTSNYVVFPGNERLIEIKRKYAWLLPFMGAGAFETWAQKKASTSGED